MKALLPIFILVLLSETMNAQKPGTIDLSYGPDNTGSSTINNITFSKTSTLQPDNKLLLGGYDPATSKFSLFRLTQGGLADSSFGINGRVLTTADGLFSDTLYLNGWVDIAIQPDEKIVTAGDAIHYDTKVKGEWGGPWNDDIIIARFLPDGSPDMSFGNQGRVFTDLGLIEYVKSIVIQPDGKILAAGFQNENSDGDGTHLILVRYNTDGTLDTSFGGGKGYSKYEKSNSSAYNVILQPDGKIITGGSINATISFLTMRFNTDGSVDSSFGNKGEVVTTFKTGGALGTRIKSMALDKEGRITVLGPSATYANGQVVRYLSNGSLDSSFDGDGKLQLNKYGYSNLYPTELLLQPNNKMVISGFTWTSSASKMLILTALNEDGSTDTSFGTNGGYFLSPSPDNIYRDYSNSVMQTDGKIIASYSGYLNLTNDTYNTSVRFNGYSTKRSALIVKIKRWLEHHGITWQDVPNAKSYAVQRSNDGINWTTIYTAEKRSLSNAAQTDKSFDDPSPLKGANYYRLQVVSDDKTVYSNVIKIVAANLIVLSPNPAVNFLRVDGLQSHKTKLTIIDFAGSIKLQQNATSASATINISTLKPGNYLIRIDGDDGTITKPFIK